MGFHPFESRRQRQRDDDAREERHDRQIKELEHYNTLKNKALDRYNAWRDAEERSYVIWNRNERAAGRHPPSRGTFESRHPFVPNEWLDRSEGRIPDDLRDLYENYPSTPHYERRKKDWDGARQRSRERREERRPRPPAYT